MNICIFTKIMPSHAKGGVQDHVHMLANGLARRGHSITIVTTARSASDGDTTDRRDRITIHYLPHTKPGKLNHLWCESTRMVRAIHEETPFDILHSQGIAEMLSYAKIFIAPSIFPQSFPFTGRIMTN